MEKAFIKCQVLIMEANASEPVMMHRYTFKQGQNQRKYGSLGLANRGSGYCVSDLRCRAGANVI